MEDSDLFLLFWEFATGPHGFCPRTKDDLRRLLDAWVQEVEESTPWLLFDAKNAYETLLEKVRIPGEPS
jgi:hypothetical protein